MIIDRAVVVTLPSPSPSTARSSIVSCRQQHHQQTVGEIIANMIRQELKTYKRDGDYLTRTLPSKLQDGEEPIDDAWRCHLVRWMYRVVDHCDLRRENVAVATYFLDLASCRTNLVRSRRDFQLVAVASLALSIKLNESSAVAMLVLLPDATSPIGEYGGDFFFSKSDITGMEFKMMKAFGWHLHPPTPACFMRQLVRLLPSPNNDVSTTASITLRAWFTVVEVTRFILELSVCHSEFVKYPAWSIAFAAIIIAIEKTDEETEFPIPQRCWFLQNVLLVTGLQSTSREIIFAGKDLNRYLESNGNLRYLLREIDTQCRQSDSLMKKNDNYEDN